jgi:hypothetical protein
MAKNSDYVAEGDLSSNCVDIWIIQKTVDFPKNAIQAE